VSYTAKLEAQKIGKCTARGREVRASFAAGDWKLERPKMLVEEQARLLRETLLKLDCRITINDRAIYLVGKLPLGVGANARAS